MEKQPHLNTQERDINKGIFFHSVLAGIAGALALISAYLFSQWVWKPLVTFNWWLFMVQIPQMLLVGLLVLVLTGAWAVSLSRPNVSTIRDTVKIGILAGSTAGAVVALYIANASILSDNVPLLLIIRWFALMMVICSIGSVAGAYSFFRVIQAGKEQGARGVKANLFLVTVPVLALWIIIAMTVPPLFALAGTTTGIISNDCSECRFHQDVQVERLSDQSIKISYTSKLVAIPWVGHYNPPIIRINGKDVSTQSVIQQQGIQCRIEPAEGLAYREESTVILTGEEASINRSKTTQVVVVSYNGSPLPVTLYDGAL